MRSDGARIDYELFPAQRHPRIKRACRARTASQFVIRPSLYRHGFAIFLDVFHLKVYLILVESLRIARLFLLEIFFFKKPLNSLSTFQIHISFNFIIFCCKHRSIVHLQTELDNFHCAFCFSIAFSQFSIRFRPIRSFSFPVHRIHRHFFVSSRFEFAVCARFSIFSYDLHPKHRPKTFWRLFHFNLSSLLQTIGACAAHHLCSPTHRSPQSSSLFRSHLFSLSTHHTWHASRVARKIDRRKSA